MSIPSQTPNSNPQIQSNVKNLVQQFEKMTGVEKKGVHENKGKFDDPEIKKNLEQTIEDVGEQIASGSDHTFNISDNPESEKMEKSCNAIAQDVLPKKANRPLPHIPIPGNLKAIMDPTSFPATVSRKPERNKLSEAEGEAKPNVQPQKNRKEELKEKNVLLEAAKKELAELKNTFNGSDDLKAFGRGETFEDAEKSFNTEIKQVSDKLQKVTGKREKASIFTKSKLTKQQVRLQDQLQNLNQQKINLISKYSDVVFEGSEKVLKLENEIKELTPMASSGIASMGGTYKKEDAIACCDFAYSNPRTGVMGTFDAAGHNEQNLHDDQVPLFKEFFTNLSSAVDGRKFENVEEAKEFLKNELKGIEQEFIDRYQRVESGENLGYQPFEGPAFFCGIVVNIEGQRHFITAQTDDCSLCVLRKNGDFEFLGPGKPGEALGRHPPKISSITVEEGDELIAFSDGIGDFLTAQEFKDVITENKTRDSLLEDFKEKIESFDSDEGRKDSVGRAGSAAKQLPPILLNRKNDDISIAALKI